MNNNAFSNELALGGTYPHDIPYTKNDSHNNVNIRWRIRRINITFGNQF